MEMQLWAVRMDRVLKEQEAELLLQQLPELRRERLLRMRNETKRQEPLAAYGLLRLALFRTFGLPEIPEIIFGEKGKPQLKDFPQIQFSISHTEGAVLAGLSDQPLGVDIERCKPLSKRVEERLLREGKTQEAYFRDWVRYEACVKRSGEGVLPHGVRPKSEESVDVALFPGYCAAVSGEGKARICYTGTTDQLMLELAKI